VYSFDVGVDVGVEGVRVYSFPSFATKLWIGAIDINAGAFKVLEPFFSMDFEVDF